MSQRIRKSCAVMVFNDVIEKIGMAIGHRPARRHERVLQVQISQLCRFQWL